MKRTTLLIAATLLAAGLAGCIGPVQEQLGFSSVDVADAGTLSVYVQTKGAGAFDDLAITVASAEAPAVGDAAAAELDPAEGAVDLLTGKPALVATGAAAPVERDGVRVVISAVSGTVNGEPFALDGLSTAVDVGKRLPVATGSVTSVFIALDVEGAVDADAGTFAPGHSLLGIKQDGAVIYEASQGATPSTQGKPPVARADVFNGTGVKIFESDFVADDGAALAPVAKRETITLTAGASEDLDGGEPVEFVWRFSDGATAQGKTVTHAFTEGGAQTATLTVMDDQGLTDALVVTFDVLYLVDEDGMVMFEDAQDGSLAIGADAVLGEPNVTRADHAFAVPDEQEMSGGGHDGHAGHAHGGGGHAMKLAAVTFAVDAAEGHDFDLQVFRDGELLGEATGDDAPEVTLSQLDGWYLDGGDYTARVLYTDGQQGSYTVTVAGTYLPMVGGDGHAHAH